MTEQQPLVSIVIPCYNHAEFVKETIQSVIDQDYKNIELIIIDDGSSDNSVEVIREMALICQERFIRFEFRSRENKGLCATLNEALAWSQGEFFSPIASDDIALPHKISFLIDKIKNSPYAVVFGIVKKFGNSYLVHSAVAGISEHFFEDLIFLQNLPDAPASIMRKSKIESVGGFSEDVKLEDWYMWLILTCSNAKIATYSEVVALYRDHPGNTVKNARAMYINRVDVLSKFAWHPLYKEASVFNEILSASALSDNEFILPLKLLLKARKFNLISFRVFLKVMTPAFVIRFKRLMQEKLFS